MKRIGYKIDRGNFYLARLTILMRDVQKEILQCLLVKLTLKQQGVTCLWPVSITVWNFITSITHSQYVREDCNWSPLWYHIPLDSAWYWNYPHTTETKVYIATYFPVCLKLNHNSVNHVFWRNMFPLDHHSKRDVHFIHASSLIFFIYNSLISLRIIQIELL